MTTVVNKHHGHLADGNRKIYIGRGSPLGNPYPINAQTTRKKSVDQYKISLNQKIKNQDPQVIEALNNITNKAETGDVDLICFCAPRLCHGEIIKAVVENTMNQEQEGNP